MLEDFSVSKLGRVNLIVGKNNSGKSTVLEALRIYAGNANQELLDKIADSHDEKSSLDIGQNNISLPFEDFFNGRKFPKDTETEITIGELASSENCLFIRHVFIDRNVDRSILPIPRQPNRLLGEVISPEVSLVRNLIYKQVLSVRKGTLSFLIELEKFSPDLYRDYSYIKESFIPTKFIGANELAKEWDNIVYTENEKIVINALKIITPEFEHLVFVQHERIASLRVARIKLSNLPRPVSLKSLGDGMLRILQIAIKLVSAKGGFLLIDEFENGLHYSVQEKIWRLLFEMAEKLDIQVFATTHSWDCIESFTKVAIENETTEGVLFRMGRSAKASNKGQVIATAYDKERLYNITQADIEVR
jgi:AAA15 family ATPase/GTPase